MPNQEVHTNIGKCALDYLIQEREDILWGWQIGPLTEACRSLKLLFDDHQKAQYMPSVATKGLL
ncbi:hypothetical protein BJX64DRAFT_271789 [Aspergillus heterothallicus]